MAGYMSGYKSMLSELNDEWTGPPIELKGLEVNERKNIETIEV